MPREHADITAAWAAHGKSLLVLGGPGSGKTTALLLFMRDAANARLVDPCAPVPIWIDLYTWDGQTPFHKWGPQERDPDGVANLESEPLLFILDGLDEFLVPCKSAPDRLQLAPASTPEHVALPPAQQVRQQAKTEQPSREQCAIPAIEAARTTGPLIVSCRTSDYADLSRRLRVRGAVGLNAIEPDFIRQYLQQTGAAEVWTWLGADAGLLELAGTPLYLNLLVTINRQGGRLSSNMTKAQLIDEFVRVRFDYERLRAGSLPFELPVAISILQRTAAGMFFDFARQVRNQHPQVTCGLHEIGMAITDVVCGDLRREMNNGAYSTLRDEFVAELSDRLGFLRKSDDGEYSFLHLELRNHFAIGGLLRAAQDSRIRRLEHAIKALVNVGDPRPDVATYIVQAMEHRNRSVRVAAAEAAPRLAGLLALPALKKAMGDWRSDVVRAAVEGIRKLGGKLARTEMERALAFRGRRDILSHFCTPLLLSAMTAGAVYTLSGTQGYLRWIIIAVTVWTLQGLFVAALNSGILISLKHWGASGWGEYYSTPRFHALCVRANAARQLSQIADPSSIPSLLRCLRSLDSVTCFSAEFGGTSNSTAEACLALAQIGNPCVVPQLIQVLGKCARRWVNRKYRWRWLRWWRLGSQSPEVVPFPSDTSDPRQSTDWYSFIGAVRATYSLRGEESLKAMFRSGTTAQRSAAFEAIRLAPDGRLIPFLLEWLALNTSAQGPSADSTLDAFRRLSAFLESFRGKISDLNYTIGEIVARNSDQTVSAAAIIQALEQRHLGAAQAAQALQRIGDTQPLIAALSHPEPAVRETAAIALAVIQEGNLSIDMVGLISEGRLDPTAELISNLTSQDRVRLLTANSSIVRKLAVELIAAKREVGATQAVLERVDDLDLDVAIAAVAAVGRLGYSVPDEDRWEPRLLRMADDSDLHVYKSATEDEGRLPLSNTRKVDRIHPSGYPASVVAERLNRVLARPGADSVLIRAALRSLGQIGGPTVAGPILACLDHPEPTVRSEAANTAGLLRLAEAVLPLTRLAPADFVCVLESLGSIGGADAVAFLTSFSNHGATKVRLAALIQVCRTEDAEAISVFLSDPEDSVRNVAMKALLQSDEPAAVPYLCRALGTAKRHDRLRVVRALRRIQHPSSIAGLVTALSDSDPEIRRDAALGLAEVPDESAAQALLVCVDDPSIEVQTAALTALKRIGGAAFQIAEAQFDRTKSRQQRYNSLRSSIVKWIALSIPALICGGVSCNVVGSVFGWDGLLVVGRWLVGARCSFFVFLTLGLLAVLVWGRRKLR
jgi:HEAT repeat protein